MPVSNPKKPTVIVTGNSGLIGTRLCQALASKYSVYGLDIKEPKPAIKGTQWTKCDLTSDESTQAAVSAVVEQAGPRVASVVHLAAYYDFSGAPSPLYKELTVEGTRRLLRALKPLDVEQFVFSSSLLVMEPADEGEALTEQSPIEGEWDYPQSKIAAEQVIRDEHGDIPAVILRIAGVYDEDGNSIPITQQIKRIYEEQFESYFFPGDPSHGQPFIHVEDLTECFVRVIELRGQVAPLEVFLIAEDDLMSYEELQNRIGLLIHGERWRTIQIPKTVAKAGAWVQDKLSPKETFIKPWMVDLADDHYPVDIARATERLGWRPKHSLRQTLPEMIARLDSNADRWYRTNKLGEPPAAKSARR